MNVYFSHFILYINAKTDDVEDNTLTGFVSTETVQKDEKNL